jgi:hypothetical protein
LLLLVSVCLSVSLLCSPAQANSSSQPKTSTLADYITVWSAIKGIERRKNGQKGEKMKKWKEEKQFSSLDSRWNVLRRVNGTPQAPQPKATTTAATTAATPVSLFPTPSSSLDSLQDSFFFFFFFLLVDSHLNSFPWCPHPISPSYNSPLSF